MNYSPPAADWTEKQLQDKQFAKLKMHLSGSPCRCNAAYLVDVPCFIDAESSSVTNLTKSLPCFISPLPGSHPGVQESIGTVKLFPFPYPRLCCLPPNLRSLIWQNSLHAGKHKWTDEDKMWASAPPPSVQAQALKVDTFCLLRSFLLTVGRTSDWPN